MYMSLHIVFLERRKMNPGMKQPHTPIPALIPRKGGGGGGGSGGGQGGRGGGKYLCVCFRENWPKSYIFLFFGHNQPEKCNTCILLLFSARQVLAAQAKKWKEARHSTTHLTLNPQWAKSFRPGTPALQHKILSEHSSYYVTYQEATFCMIGT